MSILRVKQADGTWAEIPALVGGKGEKGDAGADGYTPVKGVDYVDGVDGKDGADGYTPVKGKDYFDGQNGQDGADGVSATHAWNGTVLTITSASGTSSADLKGEKGDKGDTGDTGGTGAAGADGVSCTHSWSGTTLSVTSASGTSSADLKGDKGDKGDTGSTGGTGAAGKDGVSCTHSWNGTTLTVTSASGTSSADLKGEKGDAGEVDYSRLNDYLPLAGGTMTGEINHATELSLRSSSGIIRFGNGAAAGTVGVIVNNGKDLRFFRPGENKAMDLGTSTFLWNNIYLSGVLSDGSNYIAVANIANKSDVPQTTETWTFTLEDGSTVTKEVYVG